MTETTDGRVYLQVTTGPATREGGRVTGLLHDEGGESAHKLKSVSSVKNREQDLQIS